MNKDHDEDEKESFKPPPKMMELPAMQQPTIAKPSPNIPTVESMPSHNAPPTPMLQETPQSNHESAAAPKTPNLQSNMFKMQRNKS